jgi:hypothetical protein
MDCWINCAASERPDKGSTAACACYTYGAIRLTLFRR